MGVSTLKLYSQQPNGVTYADPAKPGMTVRFKTTSAPKMLDGQRTTNYVTEIVANDTNDVTLGSKTVPDALSIRIRVSGAVQSTARLAQMIQDLSEYISDEWITENVLVGFIPVTPPKNTTP